MKRKMKTDVFKMIIFLIGALLIMPGMVFAEEDKKEDNDKAPDVFELGEIVVTGSADAVTQITTIETIDKSQLNLTNSVDVSSALDNLPGVAVSTGMRNEAYFNIRGFSQRYVPVFYDGIPWYVPYDGYVDASEISTGNVSRISLTKGAASSLYGANTMGGVINIISRKPSNRFEGSYGVDFNTNGYSGNLNLGSKIEKFYFMGGFSSLDYDDYDMSNDFTPVPVVGGWYEDGGDRDNSDIDNTTLSLKIGFMPSEDNEFAVGYHKIDSEKGMPPNVDPNETQRFWRASEWQKKTYYFIGNMRIFDTLTAKARVYHDEYYNVFDAYDDATYTTQNRGSSWHSTYDDHTDGFSITLKSNFLNKNGISFAYHLKDDVHESQGDYGDPWEKYEAQTSSYGLEDAININEKMDLVLGTNLDIQEAKYNNGNALRDNDESWNGLAGLVYNLDGGSKLHFSIAKKTRFPTLKELYSNYLGTSMPNPNLTKEQSVNYEAGIARPLPWDSSNIGVTLFYSDVKDLIVRERLAGGLEQNVNIGKSRFQGLEFNFNTEYIPRNSIYFSYTYLDAENRSADRTSDLLAEAPKHQLDFTDSLFITD